MPNATMNRRPYFKAILRPAACLLLLSLFSFHLTAQQKDSSLYDQGKQLEKSMNEKAALAVYQQLIAASPGNVAALCRASVLSAREGDRQKDKSVKQSFFTFAREYADSALSQAPNNGEAHLAMAIALQHAATLAGAKEKMEYLRDMQKHVELALKIDSANARIWHVSGQWNLAVSNMNFAERAAAKMLFGGIPQGNLVQAIHDFEKSRLLDPSFIANDYDLANALHKNGEDLKAIEVLKQTLRLRNRYQDDAAIKQACQELLSKLQ